MDNDFNLYNNIYSNNNNILLIIEGKLNDLIKDLKNDTSINKIKDIIFLINNLIDDNKKILNL